jgi:hypothetical protein
MRLVLLEEIEERYMDIRISTIGESQTYGLLIWGFQLHRIRQRFAWHSSKSQGSQRHPGIVVEMAMSMESHISVWLPNWQPQTQRTLMPIRKLQTKNIWCSICKEAYRETNPLHRTPAIYVVESETPERKGRTRYYCQPHANEAQTWVDGTIWTFRQQLDYAKGKEAINGLGFEQL